LGFGSEADAPGLALWALEEVAARINNGIQKDTTHDITIVHVFRILFSPFYFAAKALRQ